MKQIIALTMIVLVSLAGYPAAPSAMAASSTASTHHCATHEDYTKVFDGMSIPHVARIMGHYGRVGAKGHHYLGRKAQYRWYPPCAARTTIEIIFWQHSGGKWFVRAGQYYTAPAPHCATESDFKQVKHGMTIAEVGLILGHKGTLQDISTSGGYGDQDRSYQTCSEFSSVVVGFTKTPGSEWTEDAKSGFF